MLDFSQKNIRKEALVGINNTFSGLNQKDKILTKLQSSEGLPFKDILSEKTITASIEGLDYRNRIFTPDVTLSTFLSQVLDDDQSQQGAVSRVIAHYVAQGKDAPSANTSAYSQARTRLEESLIATLSNDSGKELEKTVPGEWLWRGRSTKLVDGSTISMPDTPKNQALYPQPSSQKSGVGFPIARIVTVISCATGALLDASIGPYAGKKTGEHALLRELMHVFEKGDVVLGDCYYASFF